MKTFEALALAAGIAAFVPPSLLHAQTCGGERATIGTIRSRLVADQNTIRILGFNLDASAFESLANTSAQQRTRMASTALDNLTGAAADLIGEGAKAALQGGPGLPNGYGSLNPFNVNSLISKLENPNGPTASLLRQVADTQDKTRKLQLLSRFPDAVTQEKTAYRILANPEEFNFDSFPKLVGLTQTVASLLGFSEVSKTLEIGSSGAEVLVAYGNLIGGRLTLAELNDVGSAKARALLSLDSQMKKDVQALQRANTDLANCTDAQRREPGTLVPTTPQIKTGATTGAAAVRGGATSAPTGADKREFCNSEARSRQKACDAMSSLNDMNICLEESNIALDQCMGRPVAPRRFVWVARAKGSRVCAQQSQAQQKACDPVPASLTGPAMQAYLRCLKAANDAYTACVDALPKLD